MCDKKESVLDRLRKLIDDSGKTRPQIARDLKCDASTITKHYNGDRGITCDFIIKYANYFHVSADYLLGLPKETDEKYIVAEYTGLDPIAIADIRRLKINNQEKEIDLLNELIKSYCIFDIANYDNKISKGIAEQIALNKKMIDCFYSAKNFELSDIEMVSYINKDKLHDIDYYKFKIQKSLDEVLSSMHRNEESSLKTHIQAANYIAARYSFYKHSTEQTVEALESFKIEIKKHLSLLGIEFPKDEEYGNDSET